MKFTQKEIHEIKSCIANEMIPCDFKIQNDDKVSLTLIFDNTLQSKILKKSASSYYHSYIISDGRNFENEIRSFDQVIRNISGWITKIKEDNPIIILKKEQLTQISPRFYKIFEEAIVIYFLGYQESSGMIFRKALEILIKDYLIHILEDYVDLIKNRTIAQIIKHFYKEENNILKIKDLIKFKKIIDDLSEIKSFMNFVSKTFKIGNDFSHYERRLEQYTPLDMKTNIEKIIVYIDLRLEKLKLSGKLDQLNNEFEREN